MNLSPHCPPQHTKLEILWLGLNIKLCNSWATADSQSHRRVFCGKFGTYFAKYFKPEEFYYCRFAGLWGPICSSIQINLTEFHQGKVISEISLSLHLCVAVLSVPVGWHWLWGIASLYSDMLCYSSLKWVWFKVSLNPYGKQDLSWLADLPKWGRPQLQQHNRVLAVTQTVLRHSLGLSLGELTSSWQEIFTVLISFEASHLFIISIK